jgi:TATA-box binding protein (TBP) (component of TFIID and TFIIIB)
MSLSVKRPLGGTHPSAEERLVSEESAGRTPKAVRRCRPVAPVIMQARGVRISNIVCFAVIDCDIDLRLLAIALGARFDKGIFPSAVVWLHGTTATLSIFKKRNLFKAASRRRQAMSDRL